jgi:ketosteroid isomerase-like protein
VNALATDIRHQTSSDRDALTALNRDYIDSVQNSDVRRFDEILALGFFCSNPDGSLIDRAQFLQQTAQPLAIRGLTAEDVVMRLFSNGRELLDENGDTDFAIIHARTRYTKPDGTAGAGRYTDVWSKQNGRWLCVSAHVTRL